MPAEKISRKLVEELQSRFKQEHSHGSAIISSYGGLGFEDIKEAKATRDFKEIRKWYVERLPIGTKCVVVYVQPSGSTYSAWLGKIVTVTGYTAECVIIEDSRGNEKKMYGSRILTLDEFHDMTDMDIWLSP